MPDYRRWYVPGGTYFFTLTTAGRAPWLCDPVALACLRTAIQRCQERRPFDLSAMVVLPEHLHAIWALPAGDTAYSERWAAIKAVFSRDWLNQGGHEQPGSDSKVAHRHRGVWQRRFWEHTIRDESDLARHFDYIHYNPVKHGLAKCPHHWPHSTLHRWASRGWYSPDWGCAKRGGPGPPDFKGIEGSVGE